MTYLLDTSAISELFKSRPDPGLAEWMADADEFGMFLSVMTIAELRDSVECLPTGRRRSKLEEWLDEALPARFADRVLEVDLATASAWARIVAERRRAGRPITTVDALIAATAACHGLVVVTRHVDDFDGLDIHVFCPWSS